MVASDAAGAELLDPARIRPSASLRGAPDLAMWRNPTLWLFVAFAATFALSMTYLWGVIPAWIAIVVGAVSRYLGFTVLHESSHRVAHRNRRINEFVGWPTGLALTVTLPLFRSCHTKHHAATNQEGIDPDLDVARAPRWLRPLWLLSPLWTYRTHYFRDGWAKTRAHFWTQILVDVALVGGIVAAVVTGHTTALLVAFVVPTLLALAVLTFAFDLVPHLPYDSTERFYDTRALPSRVLNIVMLGQNYHLVHHLWNTVPWYRYERVYAETRDDLSAIGARVDWGD